MECGVVFDECLIFVGLGRRIVCRSKVFCELFTDRSVCFSVVETILSTYRVATLHPIN